MDKYKLPIGISVLTITPTTFLFLLAIYFLYQDIVALLVLIAISSSFVFMPRYVLLENDSLIIKKVIGSIRIQYEEVRDIAYIKRLSLKSIRLFGIAGIFGYFGYFALPEANVLCYARRTNDMVLIEADKNYLIAPENAEKFIDELERRIRSIT